MAPNQRVMGDQPRHGFHQSNVPSRQMRVHQAQLYHPNLTPQLLLEDHRRLSREFGPYNMPQQPGFQLSVNNLSHQQYDTYAFDAQAGRASPMTATPPFTPSPASSQAHLGLYSSSSTPEEFVLGHNVGWTENDGYISSTSPGTGNHWGQLGSFDAQGIFHNGVKNGPAAQPLQSPGLGNFAMGGHQLKPSNMYLQQCLPQGQFMMISSPYAEIGHTAQPYQQTLNYTMTRPSPTQSVQQAPTRRCKQSAATMPCKTGTSSQYQYSNTTPNSTRNSGGQVNDAILKKSSQNSSHMSRSSLQSQPQPERNLPMNTPKMTSGRRSTPAPTWPSLENDTSVAIAQPEPYTTSAFEGNLAISCVNGTVLDLNQVGAGTDTFAHSTALDRSTPDSGEKLIPVAGQMSQVDVPIPGVGSPSQFIPLAVENSGPEETFVRGSTQPIGPANSKKRSRDTEEANVIEFTTKKQRLQEPLAAMDVEDSGNENEGEILDHTTRSSDSLFASEDGITSTVPTDLSPSRHDEQDKETDDLEQMTENFTAAELANPDILSMERRHDLLNRAHNMDITPTTNQAIVEEKIRLLGLFYKEIHPQAVWDHVRTSYGDQSMFFRDPIYRQTTVEAYQVEFPTWKGP